jgi:hypothetical protein
MTSLPGEAPPDPKPTGGAKMAVGIAVTILIVVALLPANMGSVFAAGLSFFMLFIVFARILVRHFVKDAGETFIKLLFGLIAILLGAFGAALLVGLACAVPLSRFEL